MSNVTVNLSFQKTLLEEIDAEAKRESRSRSELLREAARQYIRRQRLWEDAFALGDRQTARLGLAESDVAEEIEKVRTHRRAGK
ncbi:MAG: ribbon-helix-helix protein, CopG family [Candidatus Omnitrophica bacterium]|nr:ribbon-helix-helix protein, CopG family [Candidatus Omnitrophota bacterium]MCA9441581.1 ribbon-helix-helix protein, CopG family [Candidatus Omnitrophota bacterium]